MKTCKITTIAISLLILVNISHNAHSSILYVSDDRSITHTANGIFTPDTPFADFNATTSDQFGLANQVSSLTSSSMSGMGTNMLTDEGWFPQLISTESRFSVTFTVDRVTDFSLNGFFDTPWLSSEQPSVMLTENGNDLVNLTAWDLPGAAWDRVVNFGYSGQFNTGNTYQLLLLTNGAPTGGNQTWDFNLNTTAVPLPAGVWLFGSGLFGLIGIARHKKA